MSRVNLIKTCLGIFIASAICVLYVVEIVDYKSQPSEYERVYHIGNDASDWKYRSGQNFVLWNAAIAGIAVVYIVASFVFLLRYRGRKTFRNVLLVTEVFWLFWIIRFFYLWYASGLDH
jgi:hypothetical protein